MVDNLQGAYIGDTKFLKSLDGQKGTIVPGAGAYSETVSDGTGAWTVMNIPVHTIGSTSDDLNNIVHSTSGDTTAIIINPRVKNTYEIKGTITIPNEDDVKTTYVVAKVFYCNGSDAQAIYDANWRTIIGVFKYTDITGGGK